jgi:hypothetical protein
MNYLKIKSLMNKFNRSFTMTYRWQAMVRTPTIVNNYLCRFQISYQNKLQNVKFC